MNKLKLLVTASLLIGGCLFLSNTFNGAVTEAKAAGSTFIPPETVTLNGKQYSVERVYYSDPITDGTYLFGGTGKKDEHYYVSSFNGSNRFDVSENISDSQIFEIKIQDEKCAVLMDYDGEKSYLDLPSEKNTIAVQPFDSTSNDAYQWTLNDLSVLSQSDLEYPDYNIGIESLKYDGYGLILNYNNTDTQENNKPMFRAYKDIQTKYKTEGYSALQLYKVTDVQISSENYFSSQKTKSSLKLLGNTQDKSEYVDFEDALTKNNNEDIELNQIAIATGLADKGWYIDGKSAYLTLYNNSTCELYFPKNEDAFITLSNNSLVIDSITFKLNNKYIDNYEIRVGNNVVSDYDKLPDNQYRFNFTGNVTSFTIANISEYNAYLVDGLTIEAHYSEVSSASLRFGTNIPLDYYEKDALYGVILADGTKIEDGDDLNSLFAESNTTSASDYVAYLKQQGINVYQEPFADTEIAYVSTPNSSIALDETDPNAKYAQYALVIDGLLEHMNQTFAAVCYMEYEGQLYLMKEARHSINSVVDAYLADEDTMSTLTDNSVAILNALNAM